MPHIKSIRLTNVHFNNATQFYDDFYLDPNGYNMTYDLENGGGKSLLLLMTLQTVLPKSFLRKEKPLSLIFQGGKDRTSHVAVEWILEEGSSYRYLLTGFSARKRRNTADLSGADRADAGEEDNPQASDIEHLNWCVFYNDHRITGIKAVPLLTEEAGKKNYAGFEDIRRFIQQVKQKGLPAVVFDKIDQYQSYIAAHNLLSAEWNIIKGINSGENNIESYFRQNATSRKLIENQFVKIIEDVEALNKGTTYTHHDESFLLADTLIEIRSRLNEYLQLKGHMNEYERIMGYYEEFSKRNEEFLQAYQNYEAWKLMSVGICNLLDNQLKILDEEKTSTQNEWENSKTGSMEAEQLMKLLHAGLVHYEKEKLLAVQSHLEKENSQLTARQTELESQLNHLLALEGYGEYRELKGEAAETNKRLQALEKDEDSLQAEYSQAGGQFLFCLNKLLKEREEEEKITKQTKLIFKTEYEKVQGDLLAVEKQASALEETIKALVQQEDFFQDKHQDLIDFFLRNGEMNAVLEPEQYLMGLEDELKRCVSEQSLTADNIEANQKAQQNLRIEAVQLENEIKRKQDAQNSLVSWLKDYHNKRSELLNKASFLGKGTLEEYHGELQQLIHKESLSKLEKEIEAGRIRQKQQLSEDRGYYVPNEEILSLAGQLSSQCQFVEAGIDWLAKAKPGEKEEMLSQMPYLPFSVIVDRVSFAKLKKGRLKIEFFSDYAVPIVSLETVRQMGENQAADIYYFCSFSNLLLDRSRYEQYIHSIEIKIRSLEGEISSAETKISELQADLAEVYAFINRYPQKEIVEKQTQLKTIELDLTNLKQQGSELKVKEKGLVEENQTLTTKLAELRDVEKKLQDKIAKQKDGIETKKELDLIREQLARKRQDYKNAQNKILDMEAEAANLKHRLEALENQLTPLLFEIHDIQKERDQLSSFAEIENKEGTTELRARYKALQDALSGRNAQEDELRRNLKKTEATMKKLKDRIFREYGEDLVEIERSDELTPGIIIPTQEIIKEVKNEKEKNLGLLKDSNERLSANGIAIAKKEARLEEILKGLGQDPHTALLPHYDSESRYQLEIDQAEQLHRSYVAQMEKAGAALEKINEEFRKLESQKEDYAAFLEREEVISDGTIAAEAKEFRQFEKEYYRLQKIIEQVAEAWDNRIKTVQAETVQFVIHEPLAELGKISKPRSAAQALSRKEAFVEYIGNLQEQMQKIDRDIRQLESYQEDFARRCMQRAELVLGHLRKLEALSRIEVYGRRTNMIELRLQEFEEKERQLRMKAHIDGIVREISDEGTVDRKRVAARLSTKELLAQIADLEKATVRLYKIESIPENSRFYRWEQAIGSEGQNNSLYFIFAACLISFIRMLSITNTSVRTKKVIIADNPFGATSAVYLWDPMFKILKQNDIQLIAPGHRIPREITSRFSVSYLLNQDILQDGRMRVVVKDVRVEEDENVFRYLDTEQMVLF